MTEQKTRRGVLIYPTSPFLPSVDVKTKRVTNKRGDMTLINKSTGEIQTEIAGFWEAKTVDSTQFVKLYVKGVKALTELTNSGTKVFEVLYRLMQDKAIEKDKIYLSFNIVDQDLTPISEATFYRGLKELINKDFIASCDEVCWYWINPDFIFNGDRMAFVKEYRRALTLEEKEAQKRQLRDEMTLPLLAEENDDEKI